MTSMTDCHISYAGHRHCSPLLDQRILEVEARLDGKSGFSYHPWLYSANVLPRDWDNFTREFTSAARDKRDLCTHAKAMFDIIKTAGWFRTSSSKASDDHPVAGIHAMGLDQSTGLGDALNRWNDSYFREKGLFVQVSEKTPCGGDFACHQRSRSNVENRRARLLLARDSRGPECYTIKLSYLASGQ